VVESVRRRTSSESRRTRVRCDHIRSFDDTCHCCVSRIAYLMHYCQAVVWFELSGYDCCDMKAPL